MVLWVIPATHIPELVFIALGFVVKGSPGAAQSLQIGAGTNWIALQMIFHPVEPTKLCGCGPTIQVCISEGWY